MWYLQCKEVAEVETHTGLDQVEDVRLLLPTDAAILTSSVTIACPTDSERWGPTTFAMAKVHTLTELGGERRAEHHCAVRAV